MTVSAAEARDSFITYPTLKALLLTTERRMMDQNPFMADDPLVSAFVAARGRGGGRFRGTGRGASPSNRGPSSNKRGYNPRNNNNQRNQPANGEKPPCSAERIICQICRKLGHPTLDCYQMMNAAYEGRIPAKRLTTMSSPPITLNKQPNGTWLLGTGANAHITLDIQNLVNPKKYNGNDTIGGLAFAFECVVFPNYF
ncbi:uncharacterized protein LOC126590433 [Malus sylvestris]|uniref:uncharacterized protein LOC126590433 n=1 Tax=Malus sylvestris TaxID=3752 RepID=UPI0021AD4303|nr:uncharacterized protein LOC126590433 [Malus sylvestris]